jgi:outer membrane lipoprotein carrier protein
MNEKQSRRRRHPVRRLAQWLMAVGLVVCGWGAAEAAVDAPGLVSQAAAQTDDGTPAPDDMTAEEIAKRIQRFYKETEDFKAKFKQVYTDVAAGEKKKNWGKVYFKKPGRMRWDYYESDGFDQRKKTLVSDGDMFWIYELEFQQVFKQCLEESQLPTSLKFLMGQGDLLADFDISFTSDSKASAPELELIPKQSTPKYQRVHFQVDPETFRVEETTVYDPYGNSNRINFKSTQLNLNLPDSGFEFEPPEGARLLNPRKECE